MPAVRKPGRRIVRARAFRLDPTDVERKPWQQIRDLPERQATTGPCFADFACHTTRPVVEVDGGQPGQSKADETRTVFLNKNGYRVLRFWNNDEPGDIGGVMQIIADAIGSPPAPEPSRPQARGEGSHLPEPRNEKDDRRGVR